MTGGSTAWVLPLCLCVAVVFVLFVFYYLWTRPKCCLFYFMWFCCAGCGYNPADDPGPKPIPSLRARVERFADKRAGGTGRGGKVVQVVPTSISGGDYHPSANHSALSAAERARRAQGSAKAPAVVVSQSRSTRTQAQRQKGSGETDEMAQTRALRAANLAQSGKNVNGRWMPNGAVGAKYKLMSK